MLYSYLYVCFFVKQMIADDCGDELFNMLAAWVTGVQRKHALI